MTHELKESVHNSNWLSTHISQAFNFLNSQNPDLDKIATELGVVALDKGSDEFAYEVAQILKRIKGKFGDVVALEIAEQLALLTDEGTPIHEATQTYASEQKLH